MAIETDKKKVVVEARVRGYSGTGFGARLIRWFTFGQYSHVSFEFRFSDGSAIEIESIQGAGVRSLRPRKHCDVSYIVPLDDKPLQALYELASTMAAAGLKYDWTGIWGFVRRAKRQNPYKWFCSEFIAWALRKVQFPLSRREPYRETPSTVLESYRLVEAKA